MFPFTEQLKQPSATQSSAFFIFHSKWRRLWDDIISSQTSMPYYKQRLLFIIQVKEWSTPKVFFKTTLYVCFSCNSTQNKVSSEIALDLHPKIYLNVNQTFSFPENVLEGTTIKVSVQVTWKFACKSTKIFYNLQISPTIIYASYSPGQQAKMFFTRMK